MPENPRKNEAAMDKMCGSIREFGLNIPVLARGDGEVCRRSSPAEGGAPLLVAEHIEAQPTSGPAEVAPTPATVALFRQQV